MCLIVDVNRANHLLQKGKKTLGLALTEKLERGDVRIATGGKNLDELFAYKKKQFERIVQEFSRSGWLLTYDRKALKELSASLGGAALFAFK